MVYSGREEKENPVMVRLFFMLFVGISMLSAGVDAARSRDGGRDRAETVRSGKRSAGARSAGARSARRGGSRVKSGKATGRRGRGAARSAFVGGAVATEASVAVEEQAEPYAPIQDGKLKQVVKEIKNEVNAVEQCVMTLCDAGTDSDATTMALCSNNYKKKKLAKREEDLRDREDSVRRTLAAIPRQKLTADEKRLYDSINAPGKDEADSDELNFDSLMGQIEDMSDALDSSEGRRRVAGDILLEKAVDICAKKFPDVIESKDDFVALMTVRADNSAAALAEYYDKKAYKLGVALDQAKNKLQMAAVDARRDLEDTDTCVQSILTKGQSIYGSNFAKLAKCDDLSEGCIERNFEQFEDSKAAFADTLDGCKDGEGAWQVALLQIRRTLDESARSEIFESKTNAVEQLAQVQQMCLDEMTNCLENLSPKEAGYISFLSDDPFTNSKKSVGLSLYKQVNTGKVESIFAKMSKEYGMKISRLSKSDAQQICVPYVEKCRNKLALLSENPELSKKMLDSDLDEDALFKQAYGRIQFLADGDFAENQGRLLDERLSAIKKQREVRLAMIKGEYDVKMKETTAKHTYELTSLKNKYDVKNKKLDSKYNYEEEKMRRATENTEMTAKNKMRGDYAAKRLFYKTFCQQYGGKFSETTDTVYKKGKDGQKTSEEVAIGGATCQFEARGRKSAVLKKNREFSETVRLTDSGPTVVRCEKGFFRKKPKKGCRVAQGPNFDYKMQCVIPSFEQLLAYAKDGGKSLPASGMCLWGAGEINKARRKMQRIAKIAGVVAIGVAATVATGGAGGGALAATIGSTVGGSAATGTAIVGGAAVLGTAATAGGEIGKGKVR